MSAAAANMASLSRPHSVETHSVETPLCRDPTLASHKTLVCELSWTRVCTDAVLPEHSTPGTIIPHPTLSARSHPPSNLSCTAACTNTQLA